MSKQDQDIIEKALSAAKQAGADGADVSFIKGGGLDVQVRLGKVESAERAEDYQMGMRVFVGQKSATISSGQLDDENITKLAERAVAMAKHAPEDPYARLATAEEQAKSFPDIELFDDTSFSTEQLTEIALACEEAALSQAGISNSDGASASSGSSEVLIGTSTGFNASYKRSSFGFSAVVLAEKDGQMERDYDYSSAVFAENLDKPEVVGRSAATRTLARLGGRKPQTGTFPVIYDKRVSRSLAGHVASAINGAAIARGTSFLKDKMGEQIANASVRLLDNPLLPRGMGSRLFDGETLPVQKRYLVKNGCLQGWLLDLATAAQLGLSPTGNASRSLSGPPSPSVSNFIMEEGETTLDDMIADIDQGFYITELMGSSVSLTTGDYSRGASGFWIENGQITWPATEATIAGNLKDIFTDMMPADDLELTQSIAAPSVFVKQMMVAGS
ncbi:putative Zn-dependent protease-like protein [SAR116 cluster alpha proteobacterium HIMB100]|nr:putative Zn-dependent protease-like protein [SAR116 cluster alpha proteobacterium HIMB100]